MAGELCVGRPSVMAYGRCRARGAADLKSACVAAVVGFISLPLIFFWGHGHVDFCCVGLYRWFWKLFRDVGLMSQLGQELL